MTAPAALNIYVDLAASRNRRTCQECSTALAGGDDDKSDQGDEKKDFEAAAARAALVRSVRGLGRRSPGEGGQPDRATLVGPISVAHRSNNSDSW